MKNNDHCFCIVCKKQLELEYDNPHDGIAFNSWGNYGSKIFDFGESQFTKEPCGWELVICDDCAIERNLMIRKFKVVGKERIYL